MQYHDFNKPAKEILLDLIYFSNGLRFEPEDIEFGLPEVLDQRPDIDLDPNTFIPVRVADTVDTRYEGDTGFLYRRMRFEDLIPAGTDAIVLPAYPFSTLDILSEINAYYGIQLTADDVEDTEYTDASVPLIVRFKPESLCWYGESEITDAVFKGLVMFPFLTGFREYQAPAPV